MIWSENHNPYHGILQEALAVDDWYLYALSLDNSLKGYKEQSQTFLNGFINFAKTWEFARKRKFLEWFCPMLEVDSNIRLLNLPEPLAGKLVYPTLQEWLQIEPKNPAPYRWLGMLFHDENSEMYLRKALAVDPTEQVARRGLTNILSYNLYDAFHYLPRIVAGNPQEILHTLEDIREIAKGITNPEVQTLFFQAVDYYQKIIFNWLAFKASTETNFEKWCLDHNCSLGGAWYPASW
jgi:hypothetical protein